jgi:hypothetical protein
MGEHRGGSQLGRRAIAGSRPLNGQLGRIGVEAEADLTAALIDERRQPIGEQLQEISRP